MVTAMSSVFVNGLLITLFFVSFFYGLLITLFLVSFICMGCLQSPMRKLLAIKYSSVSPFCIEDIMPRWIFLVPE